MLLILFSRCSQTSTSAERKEEESLRRYVQNDMLFSMNCSSVRLIVANQVVRGGNEKKESLFLDLLFKKNKDLVSVIMVNDLLCINKLHRLHYNLTSDIDYCLHLHFVKAQPSDGFPRFYRH